MFLVCDFFSLQPSLIFETTYLPFLDGGNATIFKANYQQLTDFKTIDIYHLKCIASLLADWCVYGRVYSTSMIYVAYGFILDCGKSYIFSACAKLIQLI